MMDGSFFAFAVLGLLGYIVGDFQRETRYRRDARANLARAVARTDAGTHHDSHDNGGTHTGSHRDSHRDGGTNGTARREARRAAVRGDNVGPRTGPAAAGRRIRSAAPTPVVAGRGWEYDGD